MGSGQGGKAMTGMNQHVPLLKSSFRLFALQEPLRAIREAESLHPAFEATVN